MKATIKINTDNFEITCRATGCDLDMADELSDITKDAAASIARMFGLPHYTCDVKIAPHYNYRENISAKGSAGYR